MWRVLSEWKLAFASPEAQLSEAVRLWKSRDEAGAIRWGRVAAKRLTSAKVVVAQWLMLRKPGKNDCEEAIALLTSAVEAGSHEAMQVLSAHCLFGEGVEKSSEKAIALTRRQADAGDVTGQIAMVRFLTLGEYCEPNVAEALHYATLAAAAGHSEMLAALVQDLTNEQAAKRDSTDSHAEA